MIVETTDKGTLKPCLWIRIKNWWRIQRVSNYSDYTHWQKLDWCARKWGLSENWHMVSQQIPPLPGIQPYHQVWME